MAIILFVFIIISTIAYGIKKCNQTTNEVSEIAKTVVKTKDKIGNLVWGCANEMKNSDLDSIAGEVNGNILHIYLLDNSISTKNQNLPESMQIVINNFISKFLNQPEYDIDSIQEINYYKEKGIVGVVAISLLNDLLVRSYNINNKEYYQVCILGSDGLITCGQKPRNVFESASILDSNLDNIINTKHQIDTILHKKSIKTDLYEMFTYVKQSLERFIDSGELESKEIKSVVVNVVSDFHDDDLFKACVTPRSALQDTRCNKIKKSIEALFINEKIDIQINLIQVPYKTMSDEQASNKCVEILFEKILDSYKYGQGYINIYSIYNILYENATDGTDEIQNFKVLIGSLNAPIVSTKYYNVGEGSNISFCYKNVSGEYISVIQNVQKDKSQRFMFRLLVPQKTVDDYNIWSCNFYYNSNGKCIENQKELNAQNIVFYTLDYSQGVLLKQFNLPVDKEKNASLEIYQEKRGYKFVIPLYFNN